MTNKNTHAKELSKLGAALGGKARAISLTSKQRSDGARKAVLTRWSRNKGVSINAISKAPNVLRKATNQGILSVGKLELKCAVLNDKTRVVSFRSFSQYISTKGGGAHWQRKKSGTAVLPEFISASFLDPFIDKDLRSLLAKPISYVAINGQEAEGIEATIIPKVCDVWIKALNAGILTTDSRKQTAERAYGLLNALANIGIIALIDEATGYQKQKDAYQKIMEQYLAPEIRPWVKTFEEDYYKELYRLLGWDWDAYKARGKNHSQYIGALTNRLVYEKLAPGILEELKKLNPKGNKGNRKHKHHQHLSENFGYMKLVRHIASITTIMEQFDAGDILGAINKINSRYPTQKLNMQLALDFPIQMERKKLPSKNDASFVQQP